MQVSATEVPGRDGVALTVRSWLPDGVEALGSVAHDPQSLQGRPRLPCAAIQVVHGMAEHSAR
ncbi:MAG: hypothetical protein Q4C85_05820 [Actinomyces sp.]|uniref:hypothetical protein n=1 Tax=Actinomyces sp. TaxID=29317 RepID=UPI0026DCBC7A|nr:hypothetical protein [Actinomyces sp.]MDO4243269.1 hypothetical protein [Actinomyces sp.]